MSERRPGRKAFIISAAVHAVLLVPLVVLARPPQPMEFETVKVNLVSPPPADLVQPEREQQPSQTQPEPEPDPVQEVPEPEVETAEEEPEPEPEREDIERPETEAPPQEQRTETPPEPRPTEDAPEAETGGDDLNIATEGREFPYPEYLGNVIIQVKRYFRWNDDSHPRGVIYFEITRDGAVRNLRMARSSGNIRFDFAVQGAVETAGNRGAFGPLPDGYAGPFLPVQLEVEPPR